MLYSPAPNMSQMPQDQGAPAPQPDPLSMNQMPLPDPNATPTPTYNPLATSQMPPSNPVGGSPQVASTSFGVAPAGYNTSTTNRQATQGYNQPGIQGLSPQGYNPSAINSSNPAPNVMPPTGTSVGPMIMRDPGNPSPAMMANALNSTSQQSPQQGFSLGNGDGGWHPFSGLNFNGSY